MLLRSAPRRFQSSLNRPLVPNETVGAAGWGCLYREVSPTRTRRTLSQPPTLSLCESRSALTQRLVFLEARSTHRAADPHGRAPKGPATVLPGHTHGATSTPQPQRPATPPPHPRRLRLTWLGARLRESGRVGAPRERRASALSGLGRGLRSYAEPRLAGAREPRPPPLRCPGGGRGGRRGPAPRGSRAGGSGQGRRGSPSPGRPPAVGASEGGGGVLLAPKDARGPGLACAPRRGLLAPAEAGRPLRTWPCPAAARGGDSAAACGVCCSNRGPAGARGRLRPPPRPAPGCVARRPPDR